MKSPWTLLSLALLLTACGRSDGKNSELVVIGPGEDVTFQIDDGEAITVAGNSRKIINVLPGEHTVKVTAPAAIERKVTLAKFDRWVVPVLKLQCFGKLDVSLSHYGKRAQKLPPRFNNLRKESAPFKLSKSTHLHPNDFPASNQDGQPVWFFRSATCDALTKAAAAQKKRDAELAAKRSSKK